MTKEEKKVLQLVFDEISQRKDADIKDLIEDLSLGFPVTIVIKWDRESDEVHIQRQIHSMARN